MVMTRIILALFLGSFALWITALNWNVAYRRYVRKSGSSSWIPLLGGLAGAVAMLVAPTPAVQAYWWLPPLLDWGCVPGLLYTLFFYAFRNKGEDGRWH